MRRKIYDELIKWKKESNGKVALLIDGARRIGKSYIVEQFAKENYKSYILIDFNKVGKDVKELFDNYLDNLDMFFMYLSSYYKTDLYERDTLIIFDEVQLYPRARSAIKYLVADGRYDYIETGSLISIKKNVEDILIPSEERHLNMYPMDFEEFLWANENNNLMDLIRKCFEEKKPLGQLMHREAMDYFKQYLIVGGMPQAVETYIKTKSFKEVDLIKRDILNLYKDDIVKYITVLAKEYIKKSEKKIKFYAVKTTKEEFVRWDYSRMNDVIINLIINAIDAIENENDAIISVTFADNSYKESMIDIIVENTNSYIEPETINKLFTPFFTTKSHGVGIGLAVSKRIVEAHGGSIMAKSVKNNFEATAFFITMPVELSN